MTVTVTDTENKVGSSQAESLGFCREPTEHDVQDATEVDFAFSTFIVVVS